MITIKQQIAQEIARDYAAIPEVVAVVLGGSLGTGVADDRSDIDLYVYSRTPVPLSARAAIAGRRSTDAEVDNRFHEPGDEWVEAASGIAVDVMFREIAWIEGEIERTLHHHQASLGYSTCLWANILASQILFDRSGWFALLWKLTNQPYPEPLRRAIIEKNHRFLRQARSSYRRQIEKAITRDDEVSINHRVAAYLASYFDILFAVNRVPHPGEKRLLTLATEHCPTLSVGMADDVRTLLHAAGSSGD
ncbi:MAG: nucleotidyltransferase domain-containing protein [Dehalococcoidia bacterium]